MGRTIAILIAVLALTGAGMAAPGSARAYPPSLDKLNDEFMESFFGFQPSAGTRAGFHQYDTRMESYDAARVRRQIALYARFEKRLQALDARGWSRWARDDREMLLCFVRSRIFELQTQRTWQQNPDYYSSVLSDSTFLLMVRNFAPLKARLAALTARERQMPALLREARANLQNPPRIFTEMRAASSLNRNSMNSRAAFGFFALAITAEGATISTAPSVG